MGYTHYWKFNQQPTPEKFTEFVEGVRQITATADEAGIPNRRGTITNPTMCDSMASAMERMRLSYVGLPVGDERYDDSML
jgi:hypothetical protein